MDVFLISKSTAKPTIYQIMILLNGIIVVNNGGILGKLHALNKRGIKGAKTVGWRLV